MCVQMSGGKFSAEGTTEPRPKEGKLETNESRGGASKRGCMGTSSAGRGNAGVFPGREGRPAWLRDAA